MLTETGRVIAVDDDGVWVETLKTSACAKCAAKHGCGQSLLGEFSAASNMTLIKAHVFAGSPTLNVGDPVTIGIEENALVKGALIAYIVPLGFFIFGAAIFNNFFNAEILVVIGAFLGLIIGGIFVKIYAQNYQYDTGFQARIIHKNIESQ